MIMIIIQAAPPNGNIRVEFKKASAVAAEEVNKANIIIIIIIIIIFVVIIIIIIVIIEVTHTRSSETQEARAGGTSPNRLLFSSLTKIFGFDLRNIVFLFKKYYIPNSRNIVKCRQKYFLICKSELLLN